MSNTQSQVAPPVHHKPATIAMLLGRDPSTPTNSPSSDEDSGPPVYGIENVVGAVISGGQLHGEIIRRASRFSVEKRHA
jgi:hypothetical protein